MPLRWPLASPSPRDRGLHAELLTRFTAFLLRDGAGDGKASFVIS